MSGRYALAFGRGARRHSLRQKALEAGLGISAELDELLVVSDSATRVMAGPGSVAIGQIFDHDNQLVTALDERSAPTSPRPGRCGWWGNFCLFGTSPGKGRWAYRDPSGGQPAYQLAGGDLFVSDAGVAASLGLVENRSIDPGFVVHWLQFPHLRSSRTGLADVRELVPGTIRRKAAGGWFDELAWNPWQFTRREPRAFDAEAEELRAVALATIGRQVAGSRGLLQLSGGVDSSIIAASLHHSVIEFSAVTFATRSADGDERHYARSVAERCGAALHEITEEDLPCILTAPSERTFRPGSNPVLLPLDRAIEQHRREIDADLLVDGGGGDNLFCYLTSAVPVLDALAAGRPGIAIEAARNIAERADANLWQVAVAALRRVRSAGRAHWREDRSFLLPEVLLGAPDRHPWLAPRRFSLPGKRDHVASLVQIQHFLDRRIGAGTPSVHPLMAKPLLELCLSIPTWDWVRGGIDRAVAREAFADLLPGCVTARRSKGTLQGLFQRFFMRLRVDLRDLLLGGELRRLAIIDLGAVEAAFGGGSWTADEVQMRLSEMAAMELWLQSWRG